MYGRKEAKYCLGVPHAADLVGVWGTFDSLFNFSSGDRKLSNQMIQAWTNFAHTLDPNSGSPAGKLQPAWEQHTATSDQTYIFDAKFMWTTSHNMQDRIASHCATISDGSIPWGAPELV